MQVWSELDHRLAIVKRFPLIPKLHEQSVAEHCFNVQRIAMRLVQQHYFELLPDEFMDMMFWAHHHDDLEALSGDISTMVKPYFDEDAFAVEHSDILPVCFPASDKIRKIIKLADLLDGYWFLCVERSLGNDYISRHVEHEPGRIKQWVVENYPADRKLYVGVELIIREMAGAESLRYSRRGR